MNNITLKQIMSVVDRVNIYDLDNDKDYYYDDYEKFISSEDPVKWLVKEIYAIPEGELVVAISKEEEDA